MSELEHQRLTTLDAIDRRRDESSVKSVPNRGDLNVASPRSLRELASSIRSAAWNDRSTSAEECAEFVDDPGWAPNAALRIAALLDHLSELSSILGRDLQISPLSEPETYPCPDMPGGNWQAMPFPDFASTFAEQQSNSEVLVFDAKTREFILRARSWRGEIIEIVDLGSLSSRIDRQTSITRNGSDNNAKKAAKEEVNRLELKPSNWADALVRAGFIRPHFGPHLTGDLFKRHVNGKDRLDVTVDVNAIAHGLVNHLARIVPRVDFARSAITDLEIQRLADHDRSTWRKACRVLESFPKDGPAWRALGLPDATALLVARAEQGGKKAVGADALLAHNFEDSGRRAFGVRSVLLTTDNGLARTIAARIQDAVWVGYVDPLAKEERFASPLFSWPKDEVTESRYSSLADLFDEILVCGVAEGIIATDGSLVIEVRAHIEREHQFVWDWQNRSLFVRGLLSQSRVTIPIPKLSWPLRQLAVPRDVPLSGARVTIEHVVVAMDWVRRSVGTVNRQNLPLAGSPRDEAWNFLRAVRLVDENGSARGQAELSRAAADNDLDSVRAILLSFDPITRIVRNLPAEACPIEQVKQDSGLSERTFGSAVSLAVSGGLIWRDGDLLGSGLGMISRDDFKQWLLSKSQEPVRISDLAEAATKELQLSPVRFRGALAAIIDDPIFSGFRGGSVEARPLDSRVLAISPEGRFSVEKLQVDDILGLRSLAVRK